MKLFYLLIYLFVTCVFSIPSLATDTPQQVKKQLNNYLWDAARSGNKHVIDDFINAKYDLNVQDEHGYTAVILSAYNGHATVLESLLNAGADPCIQDKRGNSALMGALFKGELKIARRLISTQCNPDIRNNRGQTAAMYAALFQRHELLLDLEASGADMYAADIDGNNVMALSQGEIHNR